MTEEKTDEIIALESEIATLKADLEKVTGERDKAGSEIARLQDYICKRLSVDKPDNSPSDPDFKTAYINAIKEQK